MKWKDEPPCVANCPNQALKFEERDEAAKVETETKVK
jgi:Fe-S-cluster-containing hydrogenase component 2